MIQRRRNFNQIPWNDKDAVRQLIKQGQYNYNEIAKMMRVYVKDVRAEALRNN